MIIGIDMGGTHIDGVIIEEGRITRSVKRPVDRSDLFGTIWQALRTLLDGQTPDAIERIHLSTTVSTNAIVEGQAANVGVILQTGPGLKYPFDDLGPHVHDVEGSIDHRGEIVSPLDPEALAAIGDSLKHSNVEALCAVTKFSTRNPEVEQQIKEAFNNDYEEVTMGHSLSGRLNFPRRVQTAYLNAGVAGVFRGFAKSVQEALEQEGIEAPVFILKADGGTVDLETAMARPVESILSGPAASFMGMRALFPDRAEDAVLLDIGGTTTDIFFLVDGLPVFEPHGIAIDGRKTLVRAVFSESVGLGGDSSVRIEDGAVKIGPERLGPAAGFGGHQATPTDALSVLGLMETDKPAAALSAIEALAAETDSAPEELAQRIADQFCTAINQRIRQILDRLNSQPVYTIRELLEGQKITPRLVRVIGGPAAALSDTLSEHVGLPVVVPRNYEIANAVGAALAKPTAELSLHADTERRLLSIPELGVYESIDRSFTLAEAEQIALSHVQVLGLKMGLTDENLEAEITESASFNMVQGYYGADKNIRVRAQIKPGLLQNLEADYES